MRIASLISSATEVVCALGFEKSLVARSHECDYPESVRNLPGVTEAKIKIDAKSLDIDKEVKTLLEQTLSVYKVDAEKLQALKPDILITQTQCEVCAVSLKDVENALCGWIESRPKIVSLEPNNLKDVWKDIERVAQALEVPDKGKELIIRLQRRMAETAKTARLLEPKPSVACIEWIEPLMAAGNWVPELVWLAGGHNLFGEAGKHSPWMSWEDLKAKNPDIIMVLPCGFDIERSKKELSVLRQKPDWEELKAVQSNRVFIADGNQYFNRPGPRLAESLEILAEIFHPDHFDFGHKSRGWQRL